MNTVSDPIYETDFQAVHTLLYLCITTLSSYYLCWSENVMSRELNWSLRIKYWIGYLVILVTTLNQRMNV